MRKILVVGGVGFIGSHFVKECLLRGDEVVVLDNLATGKREYIPNDVKFINADIRNRNDIMFITYNRDNFDTIVNFAVLPLIMSFQYPGEIHDVNVQGVINLLDAIKGHNNKNNTPIQFVQVSSSEVFGSLKYQPMNEEHVMKPTTAYAASKAAAEMYCISYYFSYNIPIKIARCFNTYGENMRTDHYCNVIYKWILDALNGIPLQINGTGTQTRDFSYVKDIARGIYMTMEKLPVGEVVNIGSGTEVSIKDLADIVGTITVMPFTKYAPSRLGDVERHCCDNTKAKKVLGWEPEVSLRDGITKTYQWIKQQKGIKYNAR